MGLKPVNKKYVYLAAMLAGGVMFMHACKKDTQQVTPVEEYKAEEGEELSGGKENTVFDISTNAFSFSSPGLKGNDELEFFVGNSFFKENWVAAPASTTARDGLGPMLNARSCASCHLKDGRGKPQSFTGEATQGFLMRLSVPGNGPHGGPMPDPNYGDQLSDHAIQGLAAEGQVDIAYTTINGTFADGETYTLQAPVYMIVNTGYGALGAGSMMSPRVGQQVIGMGLLEAIEESRLLSLADEFDADGDGISGRPNYVWDETAQKTKVGRFGWKANQPTVVQQTAGAFLGDMGITTHVFPMQNCTGVQTGCLMAPDGGSPEIPDDDFNKVVLYISNLAVPGRRDYNDATVLKGKRLFNEIGCAACHTPKHTTGTHPRFNNLSNQTIWPYTDLLLHDMGEELADHRPDFLANGREWRTQPLWGIGLIETVNGHTRYLHDGRARNIEEAILWHGGEGAKSREAYKALSKEERQAMLKFLNSL